MRGALRKTNSHSCDAEKYAFSANKLEPDARNIRWIIQWFIKIFGRLEKAFIDTLCVIQNILKYYYNRNEAETEICITIIILVKFDW